MALKYQDTLKGWEERGYKVTADALKSPLDNTKVNRKGERLFSWGQVIPTHPQGSRSQ